MLGFDSTVPNPARMYDYALGGKDNFAADREAAELILRASPTAFRNAHDNRNFLRRAVCWAAVSGVAQFIDIGSGLPTVLNTHEIARGVNGFSRVVYVDIDPVAVRHAEVLVKGDPQVIALSGDLREPEGILENPALRDLIDLGEPVAVVLVAVLHFLGNLEAYAVVDTIKKAMPPRSCLIVSHATADHANYDEVKAVQDVYGGRAAAPLALRTHDEVSRFFDGLELVGPVADVNAWWNPEGETRSATACYGGVGIKPGA